jgi:hypothetical protein
VVRVDAVGVVEEVIQVITVMDPEGGAGEEVDENVRSFSTIIIIQGIFIGRLSFCV